jgi:predicted flap endonuclease-1-like 5' DNA nuclease
MGLYNNIKHNLPKQFSIFQLMAILGINASEVRLARNLLKQFHHAGYIKRISKNMYQKLRQPDKSKTKKPEKVRKPKDSSKKSTQEIIALTELHGLGPKTEERFKKIGIKSVNDLIGEKPSELAVLIKGCSEKSIGDWIEEGKRLLK